MLLRLRSSGPKLLGYGPSRRFGTRLSIDQCVRVHEATCGWTLPLQLVAARIEPGPDLDAAIPWAEKCPAAAWGSVEIRPSAVRFQQGAWIQA